MAFWGGLMICFGMMGCGRFCCFSMGGETTVFGFELFGCALFGTSFLPSSSSAQTVGLGFGAFEPYSWHTPTSQQQTLNPKPSTAKPPNPKAPKPKPLNPQTRQGLFRPLFQHKKSLRGLPRPPSSGAGFGFVTTSRLHCSSFCWLTNSMVRTLYYSFWLTKKGTTMETIGKPLLVGKLPMNTQSQLGFWIASGLASRCSLERRSACKFREQVFGLGFRASSQMKHFIWKKRNRGPVGSCSSSPARISGKTRCMMFPQHTDSADGLHDLRPYHSRGKHASSL